MAKITYQYKVEYIKENTLHLKRKHCLFFHTEEQANKFAQRILKSKRGGNTLPESIKIKNGLFIEEEIHI